MIYTIGYQALTPEQLLATVQLLGAKLIDCRENPRSRKKGFGSLQLGRLLADVDFVWGGNVLGGRGNVTPAGIKGLRKYYQDEGPHCILMCMEDHPEDCHRHIDITGPHFPLALHIMNGYIFRSGDLQQALDGDISYAEIMSQELFDQARSGGNPP